MPHDREAVLDHAVGLCELHFNAVLHASYLADTFLGTVRTDSWSH
jgi:hypothetical protein